jgi:hypothetical protein
MLWTVTFAGAFEKGDAGKPLWVSAVVLLLVSVTAEEFFTPTNVNHFGGLFPHPQHQFSGCFAKIFCAH